MPKVSKKLKDNIDLGLWVYYDDYIVAVVECQEIPGIYYLSRHHGEMGKTPPFSTAVIWTLEALEARMRELQPDMRKWRTSSG